VAPYVQPTSISGAGDATTAIDLENCEYLILNILKVTSMEVNENSLSVFDGLRQSKRRQNGKNILYKASSKEFWNFKITPVN
jgi:hypothetical protein